MITPTDIMMSGSFLKFLHAFLLLAFCLQSNTGFNSAENIKCIESERQALLKFKQDLHDGYGILSSWLKEDKHCCRWEGVHCSNQSGGHIDKLDLHGSDDGRMTGLINSSLIQLQHLTYLDLSNNAFDGHRIPEFLGSLSNLEHLNLSFAGFSMQIPYQLGNLSLLRFLDLSQNYLIGAIPSQFGNLTSLQFLYLNSNNGLKMNNGNPTDINWLVCLSSLTNLDLSHLLNLNYSYHLLEMIAKIPNLRELRLSNTGLSDHDVVLPASSDHLNTTSLAILDLSSNNLTLSSKIFQWVFNFSSNLQELSLDQNFLQGSIPDGFSNTMNSLKHLDLSGNRLEDGIPESLGNICTLQSLRLENNLLKNLSGFTYGSLKCKRHALQLLDLSNNRITGKFPDLSMFTSLEIVSLAQNRVTGQVPESIRLLSELQVLQLQVNSLEGEITESHFGNFSNLLYLELSHNSLFLRFNTGWIPPFQLEAFGAESCKLGPEFPAWIKYQKGLFYLHISNASISDNVPIWFGNLLSQWIYLNISNNNLTGTIPNLPLGLTSYPSVDLSSNQLEGSVPPFLMQASKLKLSRNNFSEIVSFLCGNKIYDERISVLDLSNNQLSGKLPDCWSHLQSLRFLDLSNNKLSGNIPTSLGTLEKMVYLALRNNHFIGKLPPSLKNCTGLKILDVAENQLSGLIPSWIGKSLLKLEILRLRGNRLEGSLPLNLCNLAQVQVFDLSLNSLTNEIPACIENFTAMADESPVRAIHEWYGSIEGKYDYFTPMMWKRMEQEFKNPDLRLKSIDLSSNNLTGGIPKGVGNLSGLVSLNLSRNKLNGEIISGIGNLKSLESLDLSRNHFVGRIPSSLADIDCLSVLDLSYNQLSGKIPDGRHLQTFDESTYEGNPDLCGGPTNKACPAAPPPSNNPGDEDDKAVFFEALYMSLGIGFATGFWGILGSIMLIRSWRDAYFMFVDNVIAALYKARNQSGSFETRPSTTTSY